MRLVNSFRIVNSETIPEASNQARCIGCAQPGIPFARDGCEHAGRNHSGTGPSVVSISLHQTLPSRFSRMGLGVAAPGLLNRGGCPRHHEFLAEVFKGALRNPGDVTVAEEDGILLAGSDYPSA
jgi:hypothetical protein